VRSREAEQRGRVKGADRDRAKEGGVRTLAFLAWKQVGRTREGRGLGRKGGEPCLRGKGKWLGDGNATGEGSFLGGSRSQSRHSLPEGTQNCGRRRVGVVG